MEEKIEAESDDIATAAILPSGSAIEKSATDIEVILSRQLRNVGLVIRAEGATKEVNARWAEFSPQPFLEGNSLFVFQDF
jgi:hypothetical protein